MMLPKSVERRSASPLGGGRRFGRAVPSLRHWLGIGLEGHFSRSNLKDFQRITRDGAKPAILLCGDFPFTVNRDGNIYYARWKPGRVEINHQSPDGKVSAMQLEEATNAAIGGVTGMASGPDGSLFVTDGSMLLKVTMPGRVSTLVAKVVVSECPDDLPKPHLWGAPPAPFLRGLAVDSEGAVYGAANRCRAVLKIAPDGKVTTILRATAPWSPTGVAVADAAGAQDRPGWQSDDAGHCGRKMMSGKMSLPQLQNIGHARRDGPRLKSSPPAAVAEQFTEQNDPK